MMIKALGEAYVNFPTELTTPDETLPQQEIFMTADSKTFGRRGIGPLSHYG